MALGAPWFATPGIQNPGWNVCVGCPMGGGCQGNARTALYAHAVPPFWNCGAMVVFVQRAYFSAWRMLFDVPSVMSPKRVLPCGLAVNGLVVRSLCRANTALTPYQEAANGTPVIATTTSELTLGSDGQRNTATRWL